MTRVCASVMRHTPMTRAKETRQISGEGRVARHGPLRLHPPITVPSSPPLLALCLPLCFGSLPPLMSSSLHPCPVQLALLPLALRFSHASPRRSALYGPFPLTRASNFAARLRLSDRGIVRCRRCCCVSSPPRAGNVASSSRCRRAGLRRRGLLLLPADGARSEPTTRNKDPRRLLHQEPRYKYVDERPAGESRVGAMALV